MKGVSCALFVSLSLLVLPAAAQVGGAGGSVTPAKPTEPAMPKSPPKPVPPRASPSERPKPPQA